MRKRVKWRLKYFQIIAETMRILFAHACSEYAEDTNFTGMPHVAKNLFTLLSIHNTLLTNLEMLFKLYLACVINAYFL